MATGTLISALAAESGSCWPALAQTDSPDRPWLSLTWAPRQTLPLLFKVSSSISSRDDRSWRIIVSIELTSPQHRFNSQIGRRRCAREIYSFCQEEDAYMFLVWRCREHRDYHWTHTWSHRTQKPRTKHETQSTDPRFTIFLRFTITCIDKRTSEYTRV